MGKSLPSTARLYQVAKTTSQSLVTSPPKQTRPTSPTTQKSSKRPRLSKGKEMESESSSVNANSSSNEHRVPLSAVVSDCIKRWFKDTLKEAKTGDINMQVLVGQMYYNGYGVARDAHMGRVWITRASRTRSSAWKVGDKQPGYNASDSDSDELKCDS
ncbi:hypothetical protein ACFX15_009630 [Malus domestica]|uniref:uncharacterized protein LOC126593084 isoform X1 n=2 Tax=Malus sylvestris TaxID=3752 RepID=UPI0021ACFF34|nr:uncharacterized protein LOC126593084 isoform X1 [Malus sylvestris]